MLKEIFEEGMLDVTALLPEKYFDKAGNLKDELPDNYADDELHILHMVDADDITLPGYRFDRKLSSANLEWDHIKSADLHHPSIMEYLEAEQ